jgi:diguanylate cyclase
MDNPAPAMTPTENDSYYASMASALMKKYDIAPNPEAYAVWFHYAVSQNKELAHEVDSVINAGMPFSQDTCLYLYNKYIAPRANHKAVDDATGNAQKVLLDVLRVITDFSDETKNYNKNIDEYLDDVSNNLNDNSVKDIVRELISKTAKLKQSGEKINKKLEESTLEIYHLKKDLQQVTTEAQRDFLTGVFNRKTFENEFDVQVAMAREQHYDLCLLMIDIDHFKMFNDRFGHLLGDEVLKTVARTLNDTLKGRDVVARFGGEEFVVILPETPLEGAMKVAELIRGAIAGKELKRRDTKETFGSITVSIGVALFRRDADTLPMLIKRADDAMYQSKHGGRNRVTCEGN